MHRGVPVAGIVVPFLELHYHAAAGEGAFVNDRPMQVNHDAQLSRTIVSIGDYATGTDAERKNAPRSH